MFNFANDLGIRDVVNGSGSNVERYGVLKLDGLDITPTQNQTHFENKQTFDTTTPTANCDFCIVQQAIPSTRYGPALFSGVTPCKIEVSDENHTHAVAGTSTTKLDSSFSGNAEILWKESGTGEKNAVIRLGNVFSQAEYLASIYLKSTIAFNSTNSGWNLVPDFYFHGVTNASGTNTGGTPHSWNGIFDPRDSLGGSATLGMRFEAAGTYYGVVPIHYHALFGVRDQFIVGEVTGTFTETDSANNVWAAPAVNPNSATLRFSDGMKFEINLLLTDEENSSHSTSFDSVGGTGSGYVIFPPIATDVLGNNQGNIEIPFFFSVDSDDVPVEMQMWVKIDTSDANYWDEASTELRIQASTPLNDGCRGWVRYTPDLVDDSFRDVIANIPPP